MRRSPLGSAPLAPVANGLGKPGSGSQLPYPERPTLPPSRRGQHLGMLMDILIAIIIVAIAAVLGIVVHPVLWVIIIAAVLWLFFRRGRHSRV